jgi:hypothetical protein
LLCDLARFPYLEPEDIEEALRYAAWLAEDEIGEFGKRSFLSRSDPIFRQNLLSQADSFRKSAMYLFRLTPFLAAAAASSWGPT